MIETKRLVLTHYYNEVHARGDAAIAWQFVLFNKPLRCFKHNYLGQHKHIVGYDLATGDVVLGERSTKTIWTTMANKLDVFTLTQLCMYLDSPHSFAASQSMFIDDYEMRHADDPKLKYDYWTP